MRVGVVGDIHLLWDERDSQALDACGYDLVLFVGDLGGYSIESGLRVARDIAQLRTPALVLPGNHDAVTAPQLAAEVLRTPDLAREALALRMTARVQQLANTLAPVTLCGYSLHSFPEHSVTVLAARPHSLGGPRLAFRRYLAQRFGVRRMTDSVDRLCALFDAVPRDQQIVVLAHNGPTGLGSSRKSIYGCDFRSGEGDWGDPDLAEALQYAREIGRQVLGVVAGHMHHAVRGGGERLWRLERAGLVHVNAACVPRSRAGSRTQERHHVRLTLEHGRLAAQAVWLPVPSAPRKGKAKRGAIARARRTKRRALVKTRRALKTLSFREGSARLRGHATTRGAMQLTSQSLSDGQRIPAVNAMGVPAPGGAQPGANRSPHLKWSGAPAGTQSFAVICVDHDAPTKADDVNKPDRTVPYDLPRAQFVHWLLVDIPPSITELQEGQDAEGMTAHGKPPGKTAHGVRGLNDYTGWFKGDPQLEGQYAGYDGPWPPFNDERLHHYVFTVYALDVPSLGLSGGFVLSQVQHAMQGHILGEASVRVGYAIYDKAR